MSQELTQDYLKSILHYDPDTGVFTWLKKLSNNTKVMGVAGTIAQDGYVKIRINSQGYPAHRLAWFYFYGTFPQEQLDHINLNRSDNAIKNLRIASHSDNQRNKKISKSNKSGYKNVSWCARAKKWKVGLKVNGKSIHFGYFSDVNDANIAATNARNLMHGEFSNHG